MKKICDLQFEDLTNKNGSMDLSYGESIFKGYVLTIFRNPVGAWGYKLISQSFVYDSFFEVPFKTPQLAFESFKSKIAGDFNILASVISPTKQLLL